MAVHDKGHWYSAAAVGLLGNAGHIVQIFVCRKNTQTRVLAPFHKFFVSYRGFFGFLCMGYGIFELLPIFTHFYPFLPILHPPFLPTMGTLRRQG